MIYTALIYPNSREGELDHYRCEVVDVDHPWQIARELLDRNAFPDEVYTLTTQIGDHSVAFDNLREAYLLEKRRRESQDFSHDDYSYRGY